MRKVCVNTSNAYEVLIGEGLLVESGSVVRECIEGNKIMLVRDSNLPPLYGTVVSESLADAGFELSWFTVSAGEENKNFDTLNEMVLAMADAGFSRRDAVVALGGGMVGDLAGFAAAVYMRGIKYIQMPTTLLAAVDSSVGGKTAIDIPAGKNLVGAFHQPSAVICDPLCFRTLPERELNSGYAEVLKYAMIGNPEILGMLDGPMENLIAECVGIKAEIVSQDERDSGCRKLLNFGHTFGHATEQASNYELLHGEAVAIGMIKACEFAESKGLLASSVKSRLIEEFERRGLPTGTDLDPAEIKKYLKLDKKASGGKIDFVMPLDFGRCEVQSVGLETILGEM